MGYPLCCQFVQDTGEKTEFLRFSIDFEPVEFGLSFEFAQELFGPNRAGGLLGPNMTLDRWQTLVNQVTDALGRPRRFVCVWDGHHENISHIVCEFIAHGNRHSYCMLTEREMVVNYYRWRKECETDPLLQKRFSGHYLNLFKCLQQQKIIVGAGFHEPTHHFIESLTKKILAK